MTHEGPVVPPPVLWAQRRDIVYVTVCLEDCKDPIIKIEADKLFFQGVGGTDKKLHEVTVNLFKPINPDKTIQNPKGRVFEFVLFKEESGPFWPRLTKENSKFHWLKSDFNKWQDEDDSDEEGGMESNNLEEMMRQMGGLGAMGDGAKPNLDDLDMGDAEGPDSDDDAMPDLE